MKDYDFNKYYNAEEVKDYDVFIGPDGEYYKVRNILDKNDKRTHYDWAESFWNKNNLNIPNIEIKRKYSDISDILIDNYGFIRYSSVSKGEPFIQLPSSDYHISEKQIKSIHNLLSIKREYLKEKELEKLDFETNDIDKLVNHYFMKRVQEQKNLDENKYGKLK